MSSIKKNNIMSKYFIFLCLLIFSFGCKKDEDLKTKTDCFVNQVDTATKKVDVLKYIYGTWKLTSMITMLPSDNVPNIKVTFMDVLGAPIDKQVANVSIDDKMIGTVIYSLVEKEVGGTTFVNFETESFVIGNTNEYNFIRGAIKICPEEMMIDNGIAFDAPGYIFSKI